MQNAYCKIYENEIQTLAQSKRPPPTMFHPFRLETHTHTHTHSRIAKQKRAKEITYNFI